MPDKKSYIVKESFRFGGQSYHTGGTIELTAEEAVTLAAFLEGEAPVAQTGSNNQAATITTLEKENADLTARLEQAKKDFTALQTANDKKADELKTAKERLAALGKELGELKKTTKGVKANG